MNTLLLRTLKKNCTKKGGKTLVCTCWLDKLISCIFFSNLKQSLLSAKAGIARVFDAKTNLKVHNLELKCPICSYVTKHEHITLKCPKEYNYSFY